MIVRIVKLTFQPDKVNDFLKVFSEMQHNIASFEGCVSLKLMRDISNEHVYFTVSEWEDETYLNTYRKSDLFTGVWAKAKTLFAEKAEAWSMERISG
jgi:quinol monooxygenase YgiN